MMTTYRQTSDSSRPIRPVDDRDSLINRFVEAVLRFPESLPLQVFRAAQRVRRGELDYQAVWAALERAGLESGAPKAWVVRELYHGFSNAQMFKTEPAALAALEGEAA